MKLTPWYMSLFSFMSLEIIFDDGSRKTWDYDSLYFPNLGALKINMAADFVDPLENCSEISIYLTNGTEHHSGTVDLPALTGNYFAEYILSHITPQGDVS